MDREPRKFDHNPCAVQGQSKPKNQNDYHAAGGTQFVALFGADGKIGVSVPHSDSTAGRIVVSVPVTDLQEYSCWLTSQSFKIPGTAQSPRDQRGEAFDDPAKPTPRELDHLLVAHRMDVRTAVREAWKAGYARRMSQDCCGTSQTDAERTALAICRLESLHRELRDTLESISKADAEQPEPVALPYAELVEHVAANLYKGGDNDYAHNVDEAPIDLAWARAAAFVARRPK